MARLIADAILFDLDGTLIDSTASVNRQWTLWAQENGLEPEHIISIAHGCRTIDTLKQIAPHLENIEAEAARLEAAEVSDMEGVCPVTGAERLLRGLDGIRWGIVTSGSYALASNRLRKCGFSTPLVMVTADDVTLGKPHPAPYLLAARKLGVLPERCVVFEDAPSGIQSAKVAGMTVIGLATTFAAADLDCDVVIPDLKHVRISRAESRTARIELV